MNNNHYHFKLIIILFIMLTLSISVPIVIIPYSDIYNIEKHICFIDRIDYPITKPIYNFNNNDNMWGQCICGRGCVNLSPCVKLYSNLSKEIVKKEYPYSKNEKCTFHEKECLKKISNKEIHKSLNDSKKIYEKYINKTIDCYINNNNKNAYIYFNIRYGIIIPFIISLILLCSCLCYSIFFNLCV